MTINKHNVHDLENITRFLLDDFAKSFKLADTTIVPEIYFVRDSQTEKKEVNAQMLAERIRALAPYKEVPIVVMASSRRGKGGSGPKASAVIT